MRQQKADEMLKFIQEYIKENGIAPSVREIAEGTGFRSTSTIHRYLHQMQEDGILKIDSTKKRAIFISDSRLEGVPVIAQVKPGTALLDKKNIKEYITVLPESENSVFAFYLTRNYTKAGIRQGDLLIAEYSEIPQENKITVYLNKDGIPEITAGKVPSGGSAVGSVISMIRYF